MHSLVDDDTVGHVLIPLLFGLKSFRWVAYRRGIRLTMKKRHRLLYRLVHPPAQRDCNPDPRNDEKKLLHVSGPKEIQCGETWDELV
jgi:hypothetical protein